MTRALPLRRTCPLPRQRGMALIEVLVSILIFAFGVLGLIGLEARAINFSVDAEDRNRAALLANEIASNMWLNNIAATSAAVWANDVAVINAAWQAQVSNTAAAGVPNGTVNITAVAGSLNSADIVITWKPPSRAATDDLSTFTTRVILP